MQEKQKEVRNEEICKINWFDTCQPKLDYIQTTTKLCP